MRRALGGRGRAAPRPKDRRGAADALLLGAAVVIAGVIVVPGSMASWAQQLNTEGVAITTGSAELTVSRTSGAAPALTPGTSSTRSTYLVTNTGDVPLQLRAALSATPGALGANTTLSISAGQDCTASAVTIVPGGPAATLWRVEAGQQSTLCTSFALSAATPDTAQDEAPPAFEIALTGAQSR